MKPVLSVRGRPFLRLSRTILPADLGIGATAASLSVVGGGRGWSFALSDTAGGRFAISGQNLVIGSAGLDPASVPMPAIALTASNGRRSLRKRFALTLRRPLPALPLATGARVAVIGDSVAGYNNYGGTPVPAADAAAGSYAYGPVELAFAADPRFDLDSWYDPADPLGRNLQGANQGLFGDHLEWGAAGFGGGTLPRLRALLARAKRPAIVILQSGTASIASGDAGDDRPASAGYVIGRLELCLQALRNAGVWAIPATLYPRGDWPAGDARHAVLAAVNQWIRAQAGREGVIEVWDGWQALQSGGVQDAGLFFADKVHPNQAGALKASGLLLPLLQGAVATGSVFDQNPLNATLAAWSTSTLTGSAGAKSGSAVSGQVANNLGITGGAAGAASAIVCSKEVIGSSLEKQVLTIAPLVTGGAAYDSATVTFPAITTGLPAAGAWVRMHVFVEIGDSDAFSNVRLRFLVRDGATIRAGAYAMVAFSSDFAQPVPGNRGYWLSSKPMQMPQGASFDRLIAEMNLFWRKSAPAGAVIKLSRPIVRTVADPRVAWGY